MNRIKDIACLTALLIGATIILARPPRIIIVVPA